MRARAGYFPLLATLALAPTLAIGCSSDDATGAVVQSAKERDLTPDASATDESTLAEGNTDFAFDLYKGLAKDDGNLFYSPYSISLALAMTYAGAATETKTQMAKALHFRLPDARLNSAFDAMDLGLTPPASTASGKHQPFALSVANSLWGQTGLSFEKPFLDTLAVDYGSGLHVVDFESDPGDARVAINGWIADKTQDKIADLLPPGSIDASTRLVLANAIYFKASWAHRFEKEATLPELFTRLDGSTLKPETMEIGPRTFHYAEGAGYQALELPYVGGRASMVIILPESGRFRSIEQGLGGAWFDKIDKSLKRELVVATLPKFTIAGATVSLKGELAKLGMTDAFDASAADFSGIVSKATDRFFIDDVLHKAFVNVDEAGTEAAAATAVTDEDALEPIGPPPKTKDFFANRPFIFVIKDSTTNTVLFVGRVTDPG